MVTLFIAKKEFQKVMEVLKKEELKMLNLIHTTTLSSVCVEADLPFELSDLELLQYLIKVMLKQGYRQVIGSTGHVCTLYVPLGKGKLVYLAKK